MSDDISFIDPEPGSGLPDPPLSSPSATPTSFQPASRPGIWQPPTPEELQEQIPQYKILDLLGRGGMGAVYKGWQVSLERYVAIKILPPDIDDGDAQFTARFKQEAKTMAKFSHPGIVGVYDAGETATGLLYIVMEFIEGTDVSQMVKSQSRGGGMPPAHALAITAHVCDALAYAHEHGVIHRDIKPANIMMNMEGQVKVADFGLAKGTDAGQGGLTKTNMAMGTPDYVAPEALITGLLVDHRADLYAIGVMLYNMLTGEIPRGMFRPPSQKVGSDPRFDKIIAKAMEQEREHRYQTAREIRRDLDMILTTPEEQAVAPEPRQVRIVPTRQKPVMKGPGRTEAGLSSPARSGQKAGLESPASVKKSGNSTILVMVGALAALAIGAIFVLKPKSGSGDNTPLFNGRDLTGWRQKKEGTWQVGEMVPDASKPGSLAFRNQGSDLVSTARGDIYTEQKWGDVRVELEFMMPKGSNSGVFLMGEYEVNIFDNKGSGGILHGPAPRVDARKPAGEWQKLAIDFRAPRFDANGKKVAKAQFARVIYNDQLIYENVELNGVTNDGSLLTGKEHPSGPLLLQGALGQVAYRNIRIAPLDESTEPVVPDTIAETPREQPLVNTLGMKFLPVPIIGGPTGGQRVLFSVWETRVQDYEVFVKETKHEWRKPEFEQGPTHPAVQVGWGDAQAFCVWLTEREQKAGKLGANERYRLPSDHEWSCAVGIGDREDASKLPGEKHQRLADYPWGHAWPPPAGAGNFGGEETAGKEINKDIQRSHLKGYRDDFVTTAPVGSFPPNRFGILDLSGNVWEWCEEWCEKEQKTRTLRGCSWSYYDMLQSSARYRAAPHSRLNYCGFRCVLSAMPASSASGEPSRGVDLLKLVDLKRDVPSGEWDLTPEGHLHVTKGNVAVVEFPFTPPAEYDFEIEFTPQEGPMDVGQIFPTPDHLVTWRMLPPFSFGEFDRKSPTDRSRTEAVWKESGRLQGGRRYRCVVEVRKDTLRAVLDGREVVKWSGDFKRLTGGFGLRDSRHLGVAAANGTSATLHKATLVPVGDSAP